MVDLRELCVEINNNHIREQQGKVVKYIAFNKDFIIFEDAMAAEDELVGRICNLAFEHGMKEYSREMRHIWRDQMKVGQRNEEEYSICVIARDLQRQPSNTLVAITEKISEDSREFFLCLVV